MPIYEYRCRNCHRHVSLLRPFSASDRPRCPHCQSEDLRRMISRVSFLRSGDASLDSLADPASLAGLDEGDPKAMARWMRQMGDAAGEDLGPEFDEMVGRMEAGESPEDIEEGMEGLEDDL
ncbi:MAG: zinc ribbon domain-containing protein [Anaerolineae bacterium]